MQMPAEDFLSSPFGFLGFIGRLELKSTMPILFLMVMGGALPARQCDPIDSLPNRPATHRIYP